MKKIDIFIFIVIFVIGFSLPDSITFRVFTIGLGLLLYYLYEKFQKRK